MEPVWIIHNRLLAAAKPQEAAGRIATGQELSVALVQLAAVCHSISGSPIATGVAKELLRAASSAEAAVQAAVTSISAGGQPATAADAAGLALGLECLEAAIRLALSVTSDAIPHQLAALTHGASKLAVAVLQCTAVQVHNLHGHILMCDTFGVFCTAVVDNASDAADARRLQFCTYHCAHVRAGLRCCPAGGGAPVHHCCVVI